MDTRGHAQRGAGWMAQWDVLSSTRQLQSVDKALCDGGQLFPARSLEQGPKVAQYGGSSMPRVHVHLLLVYVNVHC